MIRVLSILFFLATGCLAADFYVSPTGSDANPGTLAQPLATLEAARTNVRALGSPPSESVNVYLRGGNYYRDTSFYLTNLDAGSTNISIAYRAYGAEQPVLVGGRVVTNFVAITAPAILARLSASAQVNARCTDLAAQGITDTGAMVPHAYTLNIYTEGIPDYQSELFFNHHPMTLARWPDSNWLFIASAPTTNTFTYTNSHPMLWADPTNAWLSGFFQNGFASGIQRITGLDTNTSTITLAVPNNNFDQQPHATQPYFYFNALEDLDSPGEYYIDRSNSVLYFWPTATITDGSCVLSTCTNLIVASKLTNVTFSGITFEASRGAGLLIFGGLSNLVTGCTFRGVSTTGVLLSNSWGSGITRCTAYEVGERATEIFKSGDRTNLVSGGNFITYNTISNTSRLLQAQTEPVYLIEENPYMNVEGVYIAHNLIHDVPGNAMNLEGNDCIIEYNEIYRADLNATDAGAIYGGYNWTFRGNIIRYNYLHDIYTGTASHDAGGVMGIYLDAAFSGNLIYGNVFCNVEHGIYLNRGMDNEIMNNIFVGSTTNPLAGYGQMCLRVEQEPTGSRFPVDFVADPTGKTYEGNLQSRLNSMPFTGSVWSNRWPTLANLTNDSPWTILGTVIGVNVSYSNVNWITESASGILTNATVYNNLTNSDPLFVNYSQRNFYPLRSSPVWALGFQWIPISRIGLDNGPTVNAVSANIGTMGMSP